MRRPAGRPGPAPLTGARRPADRGMVKSGNWQMSFKNGGFAGNRGIRTGCPTPLCPMDPAHILPTAYRTAAVKRR